MVLQLPKEVGPRDLTNPSKLKLKAQIILSEYAEKHNLTVRDPEQYVLRGTAARRAEKARQKKPPGRPQNAFILYRTTYQPLVRQIFSENKQDDNSKICGASWNDETPEVHALYKRLAILEKKCHIEAFGDTKYSPKKKTVKESPSKTQADDRRSLGRKISPSKASRAADAHLHLRAPCRSPEPEYYRVDSPSAGELPCLSYQETPMTSAISTPQPPASHVYVPPQAASYRYDQQRYHGQQFWPSPVAYMNPVYHTPSQEHGFLGHFEENAYPEPPVAGADCYSNDFCHVAQPYGSQYANQMATVMMSTPQPGPVLRHTAHHDGGFVNPALISPPSMDHVQVEHSAFEQPDDFAQTVPECQSLFHDSTDEYVDAYLNDRAMWALDP